MAFLNPPKWYHLRATAVAPQACSSQGLETFVAEDFEWDPQKAELNLHKHGVSFGEGATVFADPLVLDRADPDHSQDENRFICVGRSYVDRLLVVAYAERGDRIRIVSARVAEPRERRSYER